MSEVQEKFGIVVLLDALGVQNASIPESKRFVKLLEQYSKGSLAHIAGYASAGGELAKHYDNKKPVSRTFGDTFLVTWEFPKQARPMPFIEAITSSVSSILQQGIDSGILFRGAISIGQYLESETTIIGPAISDAASWHEQANWFGCITTPSCTQRINLSAVKGIKPYSLIKYNVPFKSREPINLWCVNWTDGVHNHINTNVQEWYYERISKLHMPIGTEDKYLNSEKFVLHCITKKSNK